MLVAAAVCPHPPLLLPELASAAAAELDSLRAACGSALDRVAAARPDLLCLAGAAEDAVVGRPVDGICRSYEPGAVGSFAPYGAPVDVVLGGGARDRDAATLPLSLTVGAWLLHRAGWAGAVRAVALPGSASEDDLRRCADEVVAGAGRVGLLVLGDGSARHSLKAPGYIDGRSAGFHAAAAAALSGGDPAALLAIDRRLGGELMSTGSGPWHLLGYAAAGADRWEAALHYDDTPYGVGYLVASWVRRGDPHR